MVGPKVLTARTPTGAKPTGAVRVGDTRSVEPQEPEDPDKASRDEALRFIARRTLIWAVPLTLIGALLVGLGIPVWISVGAMVLTLIVLVFEIDI